MTVSQSGGPDLAVAGAEITDVVLAIAEEGTVDPASDQTARSPERLAQEGSSPCRASHPPAEEFFGPCEVPGRTFVEAGNAP